jgi:hypothetical protein
MYFVVAGLPYILHAFDCWSDIVRQTFLILIRFLNKKNLEILNVPNRGSNGLVL